MVHGKQFSVFRLNQIKPSGVAFAGCVALEKRAQIVIADLICRPLSAIHPYCDRFASAELPMASPVKWAPNTYSQATLAFELQQSQYFRFVGHQGVTEFVCADIARNDLAMRATRVGNPNLHSQIAPKANHVVYRFQHKASFAIFAPLR